MKRNEAGELQTVETGRRDAIIILDCGPDLAMFNSIQWLAAKLGVEFKYVTLDPNRSYYLDPFQLIDTSPEAVANAIQSAASLYYGGGYGTWHYSLRTFEALLPVAF